LSLYLYLTGLGKIVKIFTADPPPSYLSFLPEIEEIRSDIKVFSESWDLYLFVDCGSLNNTRVPAELVRDKLILNIDHHVSNNKYGWLNLVEPLASSTCEIIYSYFKAVGQAVDKRLATCLLAGILGDTSGFIHSTTQVETIKIASELIKTGVKIHQIFNFVVKLFASLTLDFRAFHI